MQRKGSRYAVYSKAGKFEMLVGEFEKVEGLSSIGLWISVVDYHIDRVKDTIFIRTTGI